MRASLCLAFLLLLACGASKQQYVQRGNEFFAKGQLADATLNYRNALKKDPAYAEAHYRLGLLLNKEAKFSEALATLEKAVALQPNHEAARLVLAKLYLDGLIYLPTPPQPFYDKLQRLAQDYLKADPKSFHGNRLLGHLALLDSKPVEAATHFRAALAAQPDSAEIATLLTQSLLSSAQDTEAETFALKALAAHPAHGALYDLLYVHYRSTKRLREAEELLRHRIAANPKDSLGLAQLARHYQSLRQSKQVDETLARLTSSGTSFPDGLLVAGDFLRDTGDPQRAVAIYQKGVQAGPPADDIHRKRLVEVYLRTNQTKEAAALLDTLLQANANDQEAIAARASLHAASGQPAEIETAIAAFTKLVEANPQLVSYRYDLASALRLRGREEEARQQLLQTIKLDPNHLPSLEELANMSIQRANAQEAFTYASRALAVNPKLPRTRLVYSAALALQGKSQEARQEINALIRELPALREARLQLALLNMQDKRFKEAEAIYKQFYQPGQSDPRILRGLIELGFSSGQPEKVLLSLQEEVKLQPASPEMRMMLATTAARMNKPALAVEQFQWLKQNTPPSANVEIALGLAHQQIGNWPAAITQFQLARTLAPKNADALGALAFAFQQSGRSGDAIPLYREALLAKPDSLSLRNNLAVALTDSGGDLQEALQLAQAVVGKDPANPVFSDALGLVYLKRKETANAIQTFRAALAKSPENVSCRIHLAKALAESGNKAAAKVELEVASAQNPTPEERKEIAELRL